MMFTADFILSCKKPGDLFSNNKISCKEEYRDLAKRWYPDKNPSADVAVFQHITSLYTNALKLIDANAWEASNFIAVKTKSGSTVGLKFYKAYPFELGVAYVCERFVVYEFEAQYRKYYENALKRIKSITYTNSKLKGVFELSMPKMLNNFESISDKLYMIIEKQKIGIL